MDKALFSNYIHRYIDLIAFYLNKKEATDFVINDEELMFFIKLSKRHSLTALFYKVLKETKVKVNEEQLQKLEQYYLSNLRKAVLFEEERKVLFQFLNDNQIDFLPLKGLIIKDYYLDSYTREFADNDILFSCKDNLIKSFFTKRGYEVEVYRKSNHDVYMKKPFFNFEMHRALFGETGDNEKIVSYFDNYFDKTLVREGYERYLSKEDFYIYFTAHTYKHFSHSGCGIRTLIDYYQYLKNNTLDFAYINEELTKLEMLDFSNDICSLAIKLFDNQNLNDKEEEMLLYIASSGTYGTLQNSVSKGVKKKGKFRYTMSRLFPPYSFYKSAYPWAYKTVILIPIAWLIRFFRILFTNPKKATNELKMISKTKEEKEDK